MTKEQLEAEAKYVAGLRSETCARLAVLSGKSEKQIVKFLERVNQITDRTKLRDALREFFPEEKVPMMFPERSPQSSSTFSIRRRDPNGPLSPALLKILGLRSTLEQIHYLIEHLRAEQNRLILKVAQHERDVKQAELHLRQLTGGVHG